VYGSLFLPPMQDKGTSFALMVILALVMGRAFDAREQTVTRAPEQTRQT
jgi:L-cystine uptake protein TcyP (sodium:dicarboxylate symporter family)